MPSDVDVMVEEKRGHGDIDGEGAIRKTAMRRKTMMMEKVSQESSKRKRTGFCFHRYLFCIVTKFAW